MNSIQILRDRLPLSNKGIIIDQLSLSEIMCVWQESRMDSPEKSTCRPIKNRTYEEAQSLFKSVLANENSLCLGIYSNDENSKVLLGKIEIFDYNPRNRSHEFGYRMLIQYRGRGLMKLGLEIVIKESFLSGINKIYAQTASFNVASLNLLKSLGFECDGRLREHHELNNELHDDLIMSLLSSDYITKEERKC